MNNELLKEMNKRLADEYYRIADLDDKLRKEYKIAQIKEKSVKELNEMAENIKQLESKYREIKADIDLYKKVSASEDKTAISAVEDRLMKKYGVRSVECSNGGLILFRFFLHYLLFHFIHDLLLLLLFHRNNLHSFL